MMLKEKDRLHGFVVDRIRENSEIGGRMVEMTYEKTGTGLVWLDNGEKNKVFSVTFKTLPEDSTGVFHILEHSTLCGSAKYPVREPFVELLKSSMNTFLNAMTAQDWTTYPLSSRNDQDYLNLAEVYLDAVFSPTLLTDDKVFHQEGWHIEQEDGKLIYKGVVFNEMKGAMGEVDELEARKLGELMFPDNCYGYNSGGEPADIPNLTYEQYVDTYRRFYHPSNARVYLDGAVPLEETLSLLDGYLSGYERSTALPEIVPQIPKAAEDEQFYELGANEEMANKGRLALGRIIGDWTQRVRSMAAIVLVRTLTGSNEAPLKRAILASGLTQDMSMDVDDSMYQHSLMIGFKDVKDGCEEQLLTLFRGAVKEIVEKGIDPALLEATINRMEFQVREPEEPRGIRRALAVLSTWLYGGDPLDGLTHDDLFTGVREMLAKHEFEALLADLLLNDTGLCILHTRPSRTIGDEKREAEAKRLEAIRESWTEKEFEENRVMNETLQAWQATPDSSEALATLPVLPIETVDPNPEKIPTEAVEVNGVRVLVHNIPSNGLVHINMYFALTDLTLEQLGDISMLPTFLGHLPTTKHTALELLQLTKMYIGSMSFSLTKLPKEDNPTVCTPYLFARFSVLPVNLEKAYELMTEILTETDFTAHEPMAELIRQEEMDSVQAGVSGGHILGMLATASRYGAANAVEEVWNGHTQLKWLHALAADLEDKLPAFAANHADVLKKAVCTSRLTISVTSDQQVNVCPLLDGLPEGEAVPATAAYSIALPEKLGLRIPAQIGYACQTWDMKQDGGCYKPAMRVAANILSLSYLWSVVRVQGGAYGTGIRAAENGLISTYSYRDPTPGASLEANRGMSAFIRSFCESGEDLEKFIISTVGSTEPLMSVRLTGAAADRDWMTGKTYEKLTAERRGILATTRQDLLDFCDWLDAFAEKGAVCVVGHDSALKDVHDLEVNDL